MTEVTRLLDAARKVLDCNDRELADHLGTQKSRISEYRSGKLPMPDEIAVKLAQLAGEDAATALARLQAEKAPVELRSFYREIARRAGMLAVALAILGHPGQEASATGNTSAQGIESVVYYVK